MRYTISQLTKKENPFYLNDLELLKQIVRERKSSCTNYYSPLYERLTELTKNIEKAIEKGKTKI